MSVCNHQGWAVGAEIVLSTPNAEFHFFFNPKKSRNIVLVRNYVIWSGILAKFSANCLPLLMILGVTILQKNESTFKNAYWA